jgi:hypothetical protein
MDSTDCKYNKSNKKCSILQKYQSAKKGKSNGGWGISNSNRKNVRFHDELSSDED